MAASVTHSQKFLRKLNAAIKRGTLPANLRITHTIQGGYEHVEVVASRTAYHDPFADSITLGAWLRKNYPEVTKGWTRRGIKERTTSRRRVATQQTEYTVPGARVTLVEPHEHLNFTNYFTVGKEKPPIGWHCTDCNHKMTKAEAKKYGLVT